MPCGSTLPATVALLWVTLLAAPVVALGGPAAAAVAGRSRARTRAAARIALQDTKSVRELRFGYPVGHDHRDRRRHLHRPADPRLCGATAVAVSPARGPEDLWRRRQRRRQGSGQARNLAAQAVRQRQQVDRQERGRWAQGPRQGALLAR